MTEQKKLFGEELANKIKEYSRAYVNGHHGRDETGEMNRREAYWDRIWSDVFENDAGEVQAFAYDHYRSAMVAPMAEAEVEAYVENWHESTWRRREE